MKDNSMGFTILEHGEFGEIKSITDDNNKFLFGATDIARILGYSQPHKAVERHCRYGTKHTVPHPQNKDKEIEMTFIPEGDVYRLIIKSKLSTAETFEKWVFDEVLPSLRKHGMYVTDELLENDERFQEMKEQLKAERKAARLHQSKCTELRKNNEHLLSCVDKLQETNMVQSIDIEVLEEIIEENKEALDYAEIILGSELDMTATQIAADYGISAIRLNNLLHEAGIQRKVNGQWVLYRKYMNRGYTNSVTGYVEQNNHYYVQTRWTQLGRMLIHQTLQYAGIKPICEMEGQYV